MFGFFKSKKQKRAKDLLGTAYKVYNYRCDCIGDFLVSFKIKKSAKKVEKRAGYYEHRVQYINISKSDREEIIHYIFEEERKNQKVKKDSII